MVGRVIADRWHDRVERLSSVSHPGNAFGSALLIEPCGVRGGEDDGGIHPRLQSASSITSGTCVIPLIPSSFHAE